MKVLEMAKLELAGKRVLIREDLNVPVKNGEVTSDARIRAALPTIQMAIRKGSARHADVAPGPSRGRQVRSRTVAGTRGHAPVGAAGHQRAAGEGLARRRQRRASPGGAVRERALQQGRKEGQRGSFEAHGGAVRCIRHGCIRHGTSRRSFDAWRGALRARGLCRPAAGGRACRAGTRTGKAAAAAGGNRCRFESQHETHHP